jgi:hypothetical protein
MRVYNLRSYPLEFRGRTLAPDGGSADFPELDQFVPNRDRELEQKKVIALGQLPTWWLDQQRIKAGAGAVKPKKLVAKLVDKVLVEDSVKLVETPPPVPKSEWTERPIGKKR